MAKSTFIVKEAKPISLDNALQSAKEKDARTANFHVPAETGEILTFTGDFYESVWEREENGKKTGDGTMLLIECERSNGEKIKIPFGFLRTKQLLQEDGLKTFAAAFDKNATFEQIVTALKKGMKLQLKRDSYIFPGRSSSRDIDTIIFAES